MTSTGRHVVILCDLDDARAVAWQRACAASGRGTLQLIDYRDAYAVGGREADALAARIPRDSTVRIESPGGRWLLRAMMLVDGFADPDTDHDPLDVLKLPLDDSRLLAFGQWWKGWVGYLRALEEACGEIPGLRWAAPVDDVLAMGDKRACRRLLAGRAPLPPALDDDDEHPADLDGLRDALARRGWHQAFVKLRFGAAAAGVVAYRWFRGEQVAYTSLEAEDARDPELRPHVFGDRKFHHSSRVRCVRDPAEIRVLVDWVLAEGAVVERWLPKRTWAAPAGGPLRSPATIDFRVVCIGGRARHAVVRASATPLTNLHLSNARIAAEAFERDDPEAFARVLETAERAARTFPDSLSAAVDVLLTGQGSLARAFVAEVNSFGELLHGVTDRGATTYDALWAAIQARDAPGGA